jgi:hypothetical protein
MRNVTKYTMTTKIVSTKTTDIYKVVNVMQFDSNSEPKTIQRFIGSKSDCLKFAARLGNYWKKKLSDKSLPI